jgi:hypothetical protein
MSKYELAKLDGVTVDEDGNISAKMVRNAKGGKATTED